MQQLAQCCNQIKKLAPSGEPDNETTSNKTSGVSHLRINNLISQVNFLASGKMRFPIPRYFFQVLQTTSIKLSVWPQPRVLGEPISLPQGTQLALKVEGVLRHGQKTALFRSVTAISITISTTPPMKNTFDKKVRFPMILFAAYNNLNPFALVIFGEYFLCSVAAQFLRSENNHNIHT